MATLYVDKDATGLNDGSSWTNAWTTIDAAMNDVATRGAGPHTYLVKGPKTYTETATIDTAGTATAAITFQGDDGAGNSAVVTIDATGLSNGLTSSIGAAHAFYIFKHFTVSNATSDGGSFSQTDSLKFVNCTFSNNGGTGLRLDNDSSAERCTFSGNTGLGLDADAGTSIVACVSQGNSGHGLQIDTGIVLNSLIYNNEGGAATDQVKWTAAVPAYVVGCTIDGDAASAAQSIRGVHWSSSASRRTLCVNNLIHDCDTALEAANDSGPLITVRNNLINASVTADRTNVAEGEDEITDPATLGLNADYSLASGSAARGAGIDAAYEKNGVSYIDIGALQRQEAGGTTVPQSLHPIEAGITA